MRTLHGQNHFFEPGHRCTRILILLFACILGLFGEAWGATISGRVYLPSGDTAGNDMPPLRVIAYPTSGNTQEYSITFSEGDSSATYSITIPDGNTSWIIGYRYTGDDYVMEGYYAGSNPTTWTSDEAVALAGNSSHSNIDLTLLAGHTISGQVSLPTGFAPPDSPITVVMEADVVIPNQRDSNVSIYFVTLSKDNPQAPYHLTVPDTMGYPFKVNYFILIFRPCRLFETIDYYTTTGMTAVPDKATLLASGRDWTDINLVLIPKSPWNLFLPAILNSARQSRK